MLLVLISALALALVTERFKREVAVKRALAAARAAEARAREAEARAQRAANEAELANAKAAAEAALLKVQSRSRTPR